MKRQISERIRRMAWNRLNRLRVRMVQRKARAFAINRISALCVALRRAV